jgi:anti-sigma regulatory factor (Ser/Thr protein kinase)
VSAAQSSGPSRPARTVLPAELSSVRSARRFVAEWCAAAGLTADRCDDALLLASELVTNAVLHGRSEVVVEVETSGRRVRVIVADENSRRPQPVPEDPNALDGRGLALVDAVAVRWGVDERPLGKAVWFELERG